LTNFKKYDIQLIIRHLQGIVECLERRYDYICREEQENLRKKLKKYDIRAIDENIK